MAFDAFLYLDGIPGESTDDKHPETVEVLSYRHGLSQPQTGSGSSGGAKSGGRTSHEPFRVTKALDKTSPTLHLFCCDGTEIPEVTLSLCRATGEKTVFMVYKLEGAIVAECRSLGNSEGQEDLPTEEIAMNYSKITWTYTETDHETGAAGGQIEKYWSTSNNSGG